MTDPSPDPLAFNLAAHVLRAGRDRPTHPALVVPGGPVLDYAALEGAVRGIGAGLLARGLAPGDRVLLRLDNRAEVPLAYLGAIAAGLLPVPLSAQWTAGEVAEAVRDLSPALVLAAPGLPLPSLPCPAIGPEEIAAMAAHPPCDWHLGPQDRPGYIVYTSGTSGRPRAVVHAHRAILGRAPMRDGWTGLGASDRMLHAGAFNWTYTMGTGLLDPWTVGATAIIPAEGTRAEALPALLAETDATIFAAAPGVYRRILRSDLPPLPALRHGLSAGEALPPTLARRWEEATGTRLHEAFGMSECSTFLSGSPARPAPPGSMGFPQPGRRVALLDEDGAEVPAGRTGQIAVHRDDPGLMLGYWGAEAESRARHRGAWFLTGDHGRAIPGGAIVYEGRTDDMMNAGGHRVSPIEVEAALSAHPALAEVAACELRVGPETTVIAAFYVATDVIEEADLRAFAARRLARYKVPRLYLRRDALPRGPNNKILRRRLREEWKGPDGQT